MGEPGPSLAFVAHQEFWILRSGVTVIAGRMPDGEAICKLAGTRHTVEVGQQTSATIPGGFTGAGTARMQDTFLASPQRLRSLDVGYVYVICGGRVVLAKVDQLRNPR